MCKHALVARAGDHRANPSSYVSIKSKLHHTHANWQITAMPCGRSHLQLRILCSSPSYLAVLCADRPLGKGGGGEKDVAQERHAWVLQCVITHPPAQDSQAP